MLVTSFMNGAERHVNPANVFLCSLCVKWLMEYKFLRSNSSSSLSVVLKVPPVKSPFEKSVSPALRKLYLVT